MAAAAAPGMLKHPSMSAAEHLTEFQRLQRKAMTSLDAVRDLHINDERVFRNAFAVFSELWSYQQHHRQALVEAGLKRSEIGEISSKIGQLNYTFYQRCADTRFLLEAYIFYEAIRLRQYFEDEAISSSSAVKRLRFNARFIVVCLLLGKKEEACSLMLEFQAFINLTPDAQEWQSLVDEVGQFLAADVGMPLPRSPGLPIPFKLNMRCRANGATPHRPRIGHAVIASYMHQQVKIAELPVDMFRMMQTLEWSSPCLEQQGQDEDAGGMAQMMSDGTSSPAGVAAAAAAASQAPSLPRTNPRKTMLYCTSAPQLLSVLHSQAADLSPHSDSMLLVILGLSSLKSRVGAGPATELQQLLQRSLGGSGMSGMASQRPRMQQDRPDPAPAAAPTTATTATASPTPGSAYHSRASSGASVHAPSASQLSIPEKAGQDGQSGQQTPATQQACWGAGGGYSTFVSPFQELGSALCLSPPPPLHTPPGATHLDASLSSSCSSACSAQQPDAAQQQQGQQQGQQQQRQVDQAHDLDPAKVPANADIGAQAAAEVASQNAQGATPVGSGSVSAGAANGGGGVNNGGVGQGKVWSMEHLLQPSDLQPLTRRPLMLVVDSDASLSMASLQGKELGAPVVALLSPAHRPSAFGDYRKTGSLFSMFLSAPLMAFCLSMGAHGPTPPQLKALQEEIDSALHDVAIALEQELAPSPSCSMKAGSLEAGSSSPWALPFQDAMLRQYMCRFVLARGVWAFHRASVGRPECQAACFPPLPDAVDAQSELVRRCVLGISKVLDRQALFVAAKVCAPLEQSLAGLRVG